MNNHKEIHLLIGWRKDQREAVLAASFDKQSLSNVVASTIHTTGYTPDVGIWSQEKVEGYVRIQTLPLSDSYEKIIQNAMDFLNYRGNHRP